VQKLHSLYTVSISRISFNFKNLYHQKLHQNYECIEEALHNLYNMCIRLNGIMYMVYADDIVVSGTLKRNTVSLNMWGWN